MNVYISILFIALIIDLYGIILSSNIKKKFVSYLIMVLLSLCILRYVTLFVYYISVSPVHLFVLKNLVFTSAIAIPIVSFILIQIINKGFLGKYDIAFAVLLGIIYSTIVYKAPQGIEGAAVGYKVVVDSHWSYIISVIQSIFSGIMIYLSALYFVRIKNIANRISNTIFLIGFVISIVEILLIIANKQLLPSSVVSEAVVLTAIVSALKSIRNQS